MKSDTEKGESLLGFSARATALEVNVTVEAGTLVALGIVAMAPGLVICGALAAFKGQRLDIAGRAASADFMYFLLFFMYI